MNGKVIWVSKAYLLLIISVFFLTGSVTEGSPSTAWVTQLREKLESIDARLEELDKKLNSENNRSSNNSEGLPQISLRPTVVHVKSEPVVEDVPLVEADEVQETQIQPSDQRIGFYILPFVGVHSPHNLSWKSAFLGSLELKENMGLSSGLRFGYDWRNFFADLQLSYFENDLTNLENLGNFSGKSKGLGVHLSGGTRFHFNELVAWVLGGGVGGVEQDISFYLSGVPVEEDDFLLSCQIFTGLELRAFEHTVLGLRYRWLRVEEMDLFSGRDMHLAELSLGYVF